MEHYDIGYFDPTVDRRIPRGFRTLKQRLIAFELGREYYDGARENGYGGFRYDGRWARLLPPIIERYGLTASSSVLDLGCKKGFFMHDLAEALPGITVKGVENHPYPIDTAMPSVRDRMTLAPYEALPFADGAFDFVMAFSAVYMLNLGGVVQALREIQRVSGGRSYVTLGAYETDEQKEIFMNWTLLGTTVLHVDEWRRVMEWAGYTGDYFFTTPKALNVSFAEEVGQ
ncbi:MAG: class I SAM-dependent methyltransferase [Alphaproteobacteria bacterium]|nr:class I SAM-dependent methyltransferase [Alphaproteobacteria bacterium]